LGAGEKRTDLKKREKIEHFPFQNMRETRQLRTPFTQPKNEKKGQGAI